VRDPTDLVSGRINNEDVLLVGTVVVSFSAAILLPKYGKTISTVCLCLCIFLNTTVHPNVSGLSQ
jgi:hypothetical protein